MTLAADMSVVADYYVAKFEQNAEALGIKAVYYGDQDKLPVSPVVCVEPDNIARLLKGSPRMVSTEFSLYLLVYHSAITDVQKNRRDADVLADAIVQLVHADPRLGTTIDNQLAIHSLVTNVESGYSNKSNTIMRSSRITVVVDSQELLPSGNL